MEATVLSVGKSVLNGALGYAKSALAEEVALQLGVRRDQLFITNELEMMQAFLMAAHDEGDDNQVVKVWVKQVRDVAYDVEDSLQDFAVRLGSQSWWRIRRTLLDRRHVAKQMKELRANVEDISQRNMRYHLIKGSNSRPVTTTTWQPTITGAIMSGTDEARQQQEEAKVDLVRLINKKDNNLKVMSVWRQGTGDLEEKSIIIKMAYEHIKIHKKFEFQAWIRLMRPFNSTDFLQNVVEQFYINSLQEAVAEEKATLGAQIFKMMEVAKADDLAHEFKNYLNEKRYLIVLSGIHTIEEWERIKIFFPDNKKGSRILVYTEQVRVASLCVGAKKGQLEHKQLFADQSLCAFYDKGSDGTGSIEAGSNSNSDIARSNSSVNRKLFDRMDTVLAAFKESQLIGREKEKSDIINLITNEDSQESDVISVWGMGGLGKTTLIRDVYQSQELSRGKFNKRACVTIMRPFNPDDLLKNLATQLECDVTNIVKVLEENNCLIVLDDMSSNTEWDQFRDAIKPHFPAMRKSSRIIVTTRIKDIAKHCSGNHDKIYELQALGENDARDLFVKKVFKSTIDFDKEYPELIEQAKLILKKCNGLPLAIVTIGGFLENQPKTALEWRKLNEHISAELEMNPELGTIRSVLIKSYDGLPYYLKSCFLYMPIFPEDYNVRRRRLVSRWTAEGYSREIRGKSAEEISDSYFTELLSRSMILPSQRSMHNTKGVDSCQVHDLIREIGISKSMEENLVFRLEEGCSSNTQGTARHLAINGNWKGHKSEFESIVDMFRVRSLTVFGMWRSFFLSDKMLLLRVLDLEDTEGLVDHHLKHIGRFLHLRYLSLRGNENIHHLPDSLGNLSQLETLDIKDTSIVMLPKTILKLRKLQYLHAGKLMKSVYEITRLQRPFGRFWLRNLHAGNCPLLAATPRLCCACCFPQVMDNDDGFNRHDACTFACCAAIPYIVRDLNYGGVMVPRGTRKLRALRTLTGVDLAPGDGVLREIEGITGLHKLGLIGITDRHGPRFCSAIAALSRLESLSIRSYCWPGLVGCLDGMSPPPDNLKSLKLLGRLIKLPESIRGLKNLVKLKLQETWLSDARTTMEVLGNLPNLASLHLLDWSFELEEFCLDFHPEAFPSLLVLELERFKSLNFENGAAPKLERLKLIHATISTETVLGLPSLSGLKEVVLQGRYIYSPGELEYLGAELAKNPNQPVYKRL